MGIENFTKISKKKENLTRKSVETLTWHNDTFFTGLLRPDGVGIGYDCDKCIFIDRDPDLFKESEFLRPKISAKNYTKSLEFQINNCVQVKQAIFLEIYLIY